MANNNIFQQQVTPDKPKVLAQERIFVYTPPAGSVKKGSASFTPKDFAVTPLGHVKLQWPTDMMVEQLADPTLRPSFVKVLSDEFKNTAVVSTLINPVTLVEYESSSAEIKLNRENRNALLRPELVMLSTDFEAQQVAGPLGEQYNKYRIKRSNPLTAPTIMQVDNQDFKYENSIVLISWPYAHNPALGSNKTNGYGMVKVDTSDLGALKFSSENKLQVNKSLIEDEIVAIITPLITKETVGLNLVENRTFASRLYDEFGTEMKSHFTTQFGLKVNVTDWNAGNIVVNGALEDLEDEDQSIRDSINTLQLFLGFYLTSADLELAHPASVDLNGSMAFVSATGTYWALRDNSGWEWYDTTLADLEFYQIVETDPNNLEANGTASVGSSGKWVNSDHVHPKDSTKVDTSTEIQVTSLAPDTDDFIIKLAQPTVNIPYVKTTKYLHNWKSNPTSFVQSEYSDEAYWAGTAAEFADLDPANMPSGALLVVEDDEVYEPGELATVERLDEAGILLSDNNVERDEQFVIMTRDQNLTGLLVSVVTYPGDDGRNDRRKLEVLDLGSDVSSPDENHRMAILLNGQTLGKRIFTPNSMLKSDDYGNIDIVAINPDNVVVTSSGSSKVSLSSGQIVIASDDNVIETWESGVVANKPIVSNGSNGVKTLDLTNDRMVKAGVAGGLESVTWLENNIIKSYIGESVTTLDSGKIAVTGSNNTIEVWVDNGVENAVVVRGTVPGSVKVRVHGASNRLLATDDDGTLQELMAGVAGQLLASAGPSAIPGWVDGPSILTHLPQTRLTINPSEVVANAFQGLVAVVLAATPSINDLRNNCIYYY